MAPLLSFTARPVSPPAAPEQVALSNGQLPLRHHTSSLFSAADSDTVSLSGSVQEKSKERWAQVLKAPFHKLALLRQNAKLKRTSASVDENTLRHELGHALVSDLMGIPYEGLLLTGPESLGSELQAIPAPKNPMEFLRQLVMRVAGIAGEETLPKPDYMEPKNWDKTLLASSASDLGDVVELVQEANHRRWLNIQGANRLPKLNLKRFKVLENKAAECMTSAELNEYVHILDQFQEIARFPLIERAIQTAKAVYGHFNSTQLEALTKKLQTQSFFSKKEVQRLFNQYLTQQQQQAIRKEVCQFVESNLHGPA